MDRARINTNRIEPGEEFDTNIIEVIVTECLGKHSIDLMWNIMLGKRRRNMKKALSIAVVLVAILPRLVLAGGEAFPTSELIGTWTGRVEIFGPFKVEEYPSEHPDDTQNVILTIKADGRIEGGIGKAVFRNARIYRNRGWLGRKLNLKSDFIVRGGRLVGKVTPKDPGTDRAFTIPFNIHDGETIGTIMLLPKYPLTRPLMLRKQVPEQSPVDDSLKAAPEE